MHRSIVVIALFVWATTVYSNVNASTVTPDNSENMIHKANVIRAKVEERNSSSPLGCKVRLNRSLSEKEKAKGEVGIVNCLGLEGDGEYVVKDHGGDRRLLEEGETNLPEATGGERNHGS
eukprot:Lankesteria_metandrocarpae@DN5473_c0_g1_i22.p1